MHWHRAALACIIFVCLALLGLAALRSGELFSDYRRDVEYNKEYCASKEHAEERHNSKECQSVLYRTFDDPLALLTAGLTVATIALFIATFGLYAAAARQGSDAKEAMAIAVEANRLSRENLIQDRRAWLSLVDSVCIVGPSSIDENGAYIRLEFAFKNVGRTPARNVWAVCDYHFMEGDRYDFQAKFAEFKRRLHVPIPGDVVGPNDTYSAREASAVDGDAIKKILASYPVEGVKRLNLFVFTGVRYRIVGDDSDYTTYSVGSLLNIDAEKGFVLPTENNRQPLQTALGFGGFAE